MKERIRIFLGGIIFCVMIIQMIVFLWAAICCLKDPNWMFGQNPFMNESTVEETTEILFE